MSSLRGPTLQKIEIDPITESILVGADYLTDNDDISVIFLDRLHRRRLPHGALLKWGKTHFQEDL